MKIDYLKNEKLETIYKEWPGNPIIDDTFQYLNKANAFKPSWMKVLRFGITPNPQRAKKKEAFKNWSLPVHPLEQLPNLHEDAIIWLGHATFLIQLNGIRIITDPVFFNLPGFKRYTADPIMLEKLLSIDFILLSHDHRDHCDKKSLQKLFQFNRPAVLTTLKMTDVIGSWLKDDPEIQEAGWYQRYNLFSDKIRITLLPSRHWCRRGARDFNRRLWGSFMIETPEQVIYFGSDSGYGDHFKQIGRVFPKIDVAMLGIGSYRPSYMMKESHANPKEAKKAFRDLNARRLIPMHYGTYDLSNEPMNEPYNWIQELFKDEKGRLSLLHPGEVMRLM